MEFRSTNHATIRSELLPLRMRGIRLSPGRFQPRGWGTSVLRGSQADIAKRVAEVVEQVDEDAATDAVLGDITCHYNIRNPTQAAFVHTMTRVLLRGANSHAVWRHLGSPVTCSPPSSDCMRTTPRCSAAATPRN